MECTGIGNYARPYSFLYECTSKMGTNEDNIRKKFAIIRETRETEDFWATGYYCGTAGHVSADQVARYILEQTQKLKKNWNLFDVKPFEYDINDVKMEDKSQTKLDAFGMGEFNPALRAESSSPN